MRPEALREAHEWLTRAERDLLAADQLLHTAPVLGEVAVYHCQQAAEKALKAFIVAHDRAVIRTHELEPVLDECESFDPGFSALRLAARILSPYATRFRYPGGPLEPSTAQAHEALTYARQVVDFVRPRLAGP